LAALQVYGSTPEQVAAHFVREGVTRELRPGGLLASPPPPFSPPRSGGKKRK
jgi:hypothetical protein